MAIRVGFRIKGVQAILRDLRELSVQETRARGSIKAARERLERATARAKALSIVEAARG